MILVLTGKKDLKPTAKEFLSILQEELTKKNLPAMFSSFEEMEFFIQNEYTKILVSERDIREFSTIFPRKVGIYSGASFIVTREAKKNKSVFIDLFRSETNDLTKLVQMYLLSEKRIRIPKTYYTPTYSEKSLANAISFLGFPIVIKQCNTSKGSGVSLAREAKDLAEKIQKFQAEQPGKEILLQEFIENPFEYRILIIGNSVAVIEKKIRNPQEEFRNNVALGAKEEFLDIRSVDPSIAETALQSAKALNIQLGGVDIIHLPGNAPVVLEVNSCPGFTHDRNISKEFEKLSEYLALCEKR